MDGSTSHLDSIDLMKQCLSRLAFHDHFKKVIYRRGSAPRLLMAPLRALLLISVARRNWPSHPKVDRSCVIWLNAGTSHALRACSVTVTAIRTSSSFK
jgi:hypothetical protein